MMEHKNKENHLISLYMQVWLYQLIGIAILVIARLVHFVRFDTFDKLVNYMDCLPLYLWNSWRFDIQAITYISLPAILAILVVSYCKEKVVAGSKKYLRIYFSVMLAILTALVLAEFFFYDNFQSRYNVVFFDFFDEGPLGLLQTMWQDYPILLMLFFILGIAFSIYYSGKFISKVSVRNFGLKKIYLIATTLGIMALTFVLMRGSVTQYLLQVEAFMVSPDETINKSVPNAIYLLKKAYAERANSFQLYSDEELLSQNGYSSLDEAINVANLPLMEQDNRIEKLESALFSTVDDERFDAEMQHPNVIILLNESWSQFLMEMDNESKLDLLSSLRPHLKEDLLFKNIQSVRNGTIYSLETVALTMPYMRFFDSRYRFESLKSSIAHPFKENGYHTAFITGMDPTWENVQEGLTYQLFDTIIGRQDILHDIEGSTTSAIGVYDEFLMKYMLNHIDQQNEKGKPFFVLALTTTNHPPFTFPDNMQLPELTDEWYMSPYLTGDDEIRRKYGLGFQYANKSFGDFLTELKSKDASNNTIVIAVGDHNVRSVLNYDKVPSRYKHAVPMYVYLPDRYKYLYKCKETLEERYGSHHDILPTLAELCFKKGTRYMNIGQNLFDLTKDNSDYYSYNEQQLLLPDANVQHSDSILRMIEARELVCKIYFQQFFRKMKEN